jgi:hypothetical protein
MLKQLLGLERDQLKTNTSGALRQVQTAGHRHRERPFIHILRPDRPFAADAACLHAVRSVSWAESPRSRHNRFSSQTAH